MKACSVRIPSFPHAGSIWISFAQCNTLQMQTSTLQTMGNYWKMSAAKSAWFFTILPLSGKGLQVGPLPEVLNQQEEKYNMAWAKMCLAKLPEHCKRRKQCHWPCGFIWLFSSLILCIPPAMFSGQYFHFTSVYYCWLLVKVNLLLDSGWISNH